MRIELTQGPDQGMAWHFGDPLNEQRAIEFGAAIVELENRAVYSASSAKDSVQWRCSEPGLPAQTWSGWQLHRDLALVWVGNQLGAPKHVIAQRPSPVGAGREFIVDRTNARPLGRPAGQWAFEAARIGAGVPRAGLDLPQADQRTAWTLVRLLFDGEVPATGEPIWLGEREVGRVGTTAQHYELGPVALGLIEPDISRTAPLVAAGIATSLDTQECSGVEWHQWPPFGH